MNPYDDIIKKYGGSITNSSTNAVVNPYASIMQKYAQPTPEQVRINKYANAANQAEQDINKPMGVGELIKGTIKDLPGAVKQIASETVSHPLQAAQSVVGGLLDVGPQIVNSLASIVGIKGKLPKPGETMNEYIGNTSDVKKVLASSATQVAGYEFGGGLAGKITSGSIKAILGNVIGGQLVTEAQTGKERAKQAAFDAAFGVAIELGGKALSKLKGKPTEVRISTPSEAPKETPKILYKPKDNLGTDSAGAKVLARTQVDSKTGNAIIYYIKELDSNPQLKQQTLDHEFGHIVDKRINSGNNISAELPNYQGNKTNLDNVLDDFAKSQNKTTQEVAQNLQEDIQSLSGGRGNSAENFADAVSEYRKNPMASTDIAPTFHEFMQYNPVTKVEPRITEHVTTENIISDVNKPKRPPAIKQVTFRPEEKISNLQQEIAEASQQVQLIKEQAQKFSSTGFKTGKTVKTESFNPRSINAPSETMALFDKLSAENKNFTSQRISKSNEDITDLARLTGLTENQLIKAKPGSIANAETVTAARQLVLDKAQNLMNTLKGIDISSATPEQLKTIKDDLIRLVSMQKSVAGLRTEASNIFRSLGIELMPGENATLKDIATLLKNTEGLEGDASLFAENVAKQFNLTRLQHIGEGALSTWYAAILSGPKTTARNILSTSSNILTELASKAANPKQWKEIPVSVSGLIKGLKEGVGEAKAVLAGGEVPSKFTQGGSVKPDVFTGKFAGYGRVVESVGRFLNAQDRLLAAGAREMESASLKVAKPEVSQAVSDALSKAYAESTVYHGVPKGRAGQALRSGIQVLRQQLPESKIIIPFVDTVANVLDRQFDYIPVFSALRLKDSTIVPQAERIIKEFGLKASDKGVIIQRLRDQQIGRMFLGTAVSMGALALAAEGRISGSGPTNVSERNQLLASGWRPNSFKMGDTWIPYIFLGPLSGIFSIVGNVYDKTHYDRAPNKTIIDLISKGMVGWTQTQLQQSFLGGVSDLFDVLTGNTSPATYLKRLGAGLVPIPALYSQTKDMVLRQQYETRDIVEQIRFKLGLTGNIFGFDPLQPKLNAFGEPLQADLIFGITPSKETKDRVDNFLISHDLVVTKPSFSTSYSVPGQKEKKQLTEEQYTKYVQESGKEIYRTIENQMGYLENLSPDKRKNALDNITNKIRESVRASILR